MTLSFLNEDRPTSLASPPNLLGLGLFLVALAAAGVAFWPGFVSLLKAWQAPEYSHGPLIPVLSLYLFLRQLRGVPPSAEPVGDRWPGALVMLAALAIGALGNVARIPDIVTYAFILWVGGLVLVCFGWRRGRQFWPPVLHLVLMLPLPSIIQWKVTIQLQLLSSEIGVALIRLFDIPVFLDGNIIDLGVYKLHVAEACSGLRYLFPVMSFSYVFAVLYNGPTWHKAVLLLSAVPITVLMNSFRIGVIGVLVQNFGIEHAEGFLHYFEGWVIFIACVMILFGLAIAMQRLQREPKPLSEALDIEFDGLGAQLARAGRIVPSGALAVSTAAVIVLALGWTLAPERSGAAVAREPLVLFPSTLGGWRSGPLQQLDDQIERVLGADDYLSVAYANPNEAAPVDLFVAYYHKQTEGSGIHTPDVCIPAGGWEMSRIVTRELVLEGRAEPLPVNRAVIQRGLSRQLVYYWFEQRGRSVTSDYVAKAYTVLDAITTGRTDGSLVRLITPIGATEAEAAADARLQRFLAESLPVLPRFVPN